MLLLGLVATCADGLLTDAFLTFLGSRPLLELPRCSILRWPSGLRRAPGVHFEILMMRRLPGRLVRGGSQKNHAALVVKAYI